MWSAVFLPFIVALQLVSVLPMEAPSAKVKARELVDYYHQCFDDIIAARDPAEPPITYMGDWFDKVALSFHPHFLSHILHPSSRTSEGADNVESTDIITCKTHSDQPETLNAPELRISTTNGEDLIIPADILKIILLNVGHIVDFHNFTLTCKDFHSKIVGDWFREFIRPFRHFELIDIIMEFHPETVTFGIPYDDLDPEEVMDMFCKIALTLPTVDLEEQASLCKLSRYSPLFSKVIDNARALLSYMSKHHKFYNVKQYLQLFNKFDSEYLASGDSYPLPNIHFSKKAAFEAIVNHYQWKFRSACAIDMIMEHIFENFDDPYKVDEQLSNIEATGELALHHFMERLLDIEKIDHEGYTFCTGDTINKYLTSVLCQAVDKTNLSKLRIYPIFAQSIISALLRDEEELVVPVQMCDYILARLPNKQYSDDDLFKIFLLLVRSGKPIHEIKQFMDMLSSEFREK